MPGANHFARLNCATYTAMAFRVCPKCERGMSVELATGKPVWRCNLCQFWTEVPDEETLIAEGRGGAAAITQDTTLFRQYEQMAGQDPTAVKELNYCPACKQTTAMTRAFLGADEQVLFGCPCGATYRQRPAKN